MLRYCSLFSGSGGNCTYVASSEGGLLIDAGVTAKRIETALRDRDIAPETIRGILVTHEHEDHVKGIRVLGNRFGWAVLGAPPTLEALAETDKISPCQALYAVTPGSSFEAVGMKITAFALPHDSRFCLGYRMDAPDGRSMAVVTDLGYMPPEVLTGITGCRLVHIESNHDLTMLRNGPYPLYLKQRIAGTGGHLSNRDCSAVLPGLAQAGANRFVLAHLSKENNIPSLAVSTAVGALAEAGFTQGRDYLLEAAAPEGEGAVIYF